MRPAKFAFALLFGAAVLITFLKLLFFAIAAAAVLGTLFLVFRAGSLAASMHGHQWQNFSHASQYPMQFGGHMNAQPLDPRSFQRTEKQPFARHIEVL